MEPLVRVMIIELLPVSMFLKSRETCPNQPAPLHRVGVASSEITAGDTITGDSPYPQGANQFRMRLDFVLFRHTALIAKGFGIEFGECPDGKSGRTPYRQGNREKPEVPIRQFVEMAQILDDPDTGVQKPSMGGPFGIA